MSTELAQLRARMREFIDGEVIASEPVLHAGDHAAEAELERLKGRAKDLGLWALGHPQEIGGGGLDLASFVSLNEIIGRSEWGQWAVGSVTMQDAIMLHAYGTTEQRERWLLPMVAGEAYPAVGLTEPEVAGSDPTLIRAHAHIEDGEWVINAHKWFTTNADRAAYVSVFCRTEPEDVPPHLAFSAILVPAGTPGLEIVRRVPTMGHTEGAHCEIRLTDVRVPEDSLLGARGQAFVIAQRRLGPGRLFHAMRWLGQAQRAFELMIARANERFAHGSLLAEKGEIRRYVAESVADIQAARLLTLDAARRLAEGDDARVEISLIKFWGARALHDVIDRSIQVHGALGVTGDLPLERMYREARYARIYDGPDEVHRSVVARRVLADPSRVPWRRDD
ncbi:MAG TPA: acyl-CoA dehydrogenase family protein [Solirubrobacteraceae bacterium]|jgi:alkylation response protein AidB-like acyl-CoA dehydrogenase|nr:acyl-CoA dehydrogenase family protein [Solirubrobacteraceae bacterium]